VSREQPLAFPIKFLNTLNFQTSFFKPCNIKMVMKIVLLNADLATTALETLIFHLYINIKISKV